MGRDLLIANPDKRQYISESSYGCNAKSSSYMHGLTANAVALLVCKPTDVYHNYGDLAGSWFGDRVIAVGDDGAPNQGGVTSTTAAVPDRNPYRMAIEEYADVSHEVMLMMAKEDGWFAEQFARIAKNFNTQLFMILARCAIEEDSESLQMALETVNGGTWKNKYKRGCEKYDIGPAK